MALTPEQEALDYNPELQGLSRERKLAELLMAKGMQQPQGQMISGYYVAPSWTQQLNPMANVLAGEAISGRADVQQTKLAEALRTQKGEALSTFQELMSKPETRGKAMQFAASNRFLQPLVSDLMKPQVLNKGAILSMPNISGGAPIELSRGATELPSGMESAQVALGLPQNPAEWSPAQRQAASQYEFGLKTAGATRQDINVRNQLPFNEQVQLDMSKDLIKEYSNLKSIPSQIQNLDKAEKLAASPAYLGSGAEAKLGITKFFNNNFNTNINPDKVVNTEEMRSVLFQSTMENLKKVDAQPSQQQQAIMQQAFGTIGTDPAAIPKIVAVYKDILISKAKEHNDRVTETEEGPAKTKYAHSIRIKVPETTKPPVGGAIPNINYNSLDAILNSRGVK